MSLGWKKFSFFERDELSEHAFPEQISCTCSNSAQLFCGTSAGEVVALDRNLTESRSFHAHQGPVAHIAFAKEHRLLVTVGSDDSATHIKIWNTEAWGKSGKSPPLLRTMDCFGGKQARAEVTRLAVHESAWPQLTYALGLANGHVILIKADTSKDRISRTDLSVRPENTDLWQVTGLGFAAAENGVHLFVETTSQTLAFSTASSQKSVLDEMGAEMGCTTLNHEGEFVVARPEAVYLYTLDGRGPCFVFDGRKQQVSWVGHYLVAVTSGQALALTSISHTLQIFDLRNKLIATSLPLKQEPKHVISAWGMVLAVQQNGTLLCLKERPLAAKLELLFNKSLYLVALNLAHSEGADDAVVAEIQRRYADHLYAKHDHDAAMTQYLATVGHLEPSFVIRKFLDAQRIHNLTEYLEALHAKGLASSDHTTLLLNCYTKLKDVKKLDEFLKASGATDDEPALPFDIETAIKVCRSAGYFEHALYVAQASKLTQTYLEILIEDCRNWDEALAYLHSLRRRDAGAALQKYGKALVTHRPEATTALLMQLSTAEDDAGEEWVARISDFTALYDERSEALVLLCEYILNSTPAPPAEDVLYHTLLQLYLASQPQVEPQSSSTDDTSPSVSPSVQREQALELLKRGWQPGAEPRYDPDEMLVLCRTHAFKEGLIFLYEKLRLFREVLRVYMAARDYSGVIEACTRLGDSGRGGDSQLWTDVLEYLAQQEDDVTLQIQEVLGHVEAGGLIPPLVVLQTLAKNPRLKLSLVKEYIARYLRAESAMIEEDRRQISKYEEETKAMREEVHELKTKARIFQNSKCAVSGAPLELPAVHFLCGHSCNLRSLGENERECPLCAPHFRTILDIRRSLKAGAAEQDKFFSQLKSSADGFSVIADFFGRGLLNNASSKQS